MKEVGLITSTHGIKGEVKVKSLTDFKRFNIDDLVYIDVDGEKTPLKITSNRVHKNMIMLKFAGLDSINDVIKYKGMILYQEKDENLLLENEYHYDELINLKVVLENKKEVGVITSIIEVPQGHLLEILSNNKKRLIPFRKEFVGEITDEYIVIYPIEGLL